MMTKAELNKIFTRRGFNLGELIFLVTDPIQDVRIITGIKIQLNGSILYECSISSRTSFHYAGEMSLKRDVLLGEDMDEDEDSI